MWQYDDDYDTTIFVGIPFILEKQLHIRKTHLTSTASPNPLEISLSLSFFISQGSLLHLFSPYPSM